MIRTSGKIVKAPSQGFHFVSLNIQLQQNLFFKFVFTRTELIKGGEPYFLPVRSSCSWFRIKRLFTNLQNGLLSKFSETFMNNSSSLLPNPKLKAFHCENTDEFRSSSLNTDGIGSNENMLPVKPPSMIRRLYWPILAPTSITVRYCDTQLFF